MSILGLEERPVYGYKVEDKTAVVYQITEIQFSPVLGSEIILGEI